MGSCSAYTYYEDYRWSNGTCFSGESPVNIRETWECASDSPFPSACQNYEHMPNSFDSGECFYQKRTIAATYPDNRCCFPCRACTIFNGVFSPGSHVDCQCLTTLAQCRAIIIDCASVRCCCTNAQGQRECSVQPGTVCQGVNCTIHGQNSPCGVVFDCPPCQGPNTSLYTCSDPCGAGTGCCLCDRCCDMPSQTCLDKGGKVMNGSCSMQTTRDACKAANWPPACKGGKWLLGIRPTAHTAKPGKMSIVSERTHKNIDRPSGQTECRKVYGWLQKSATKGVMEGRICNTYNQRRTNCGNASLNARKSPIMKLVRHATRGVMVWEGKYRTPCPEQSQFLSTCSTLVGCAA